MCVKCFVLGDVGKCYLLWCQEELTGQQILGGRPLCRYFTGQLLDSLCLQQEMYVSILAMTFHYSDSQFQFTMHNNPGMPESCDNV